MPDASLTPTPAAAGLSFEHVLTVLGNSYRWTIMKALAEGTPLMNAELVKLTGLSSDSVGNHLNTLRAAGIVINPRGRLYELAPGLVVDKENGLLDLGYCVLRLKTTPE